MIGGSYIGSGFIGQGTPETSGNAYHGARGRMIHRAALSRNVSTGEDALGHPLPADYQPFSELPCWVWSSTKTFIDNANKVALKEFWKGLFPREADITEDDKITAVTDRAGNAIFGGEFAIDTIQVKPQHLELLLRQVD